MDHEKEDGQHEPFPSNVAKPDNSNIHPSPSEAMTSLPNTVTIPCHHISLGDFLMLNGRPCQVIRISTSSATGQYRYLSVDVFTKQLHEESSFISNPAPSVIVQTMLGPMFKQYRVLDIQEGQIIAMTETGDVKEGLPVIDQSNLYARLSQALDSGRGSVRALVLNDGGRELVVDMKVIHGTILAGGQTEQAFRDAVRTNDILAVEKAIQERLYINTPDDDGRTALVDAIENHYQDMVELLLQQEINLEALDKNGKTVLDIAASDPEHYLTTFTLLKKGASSTENLDEGVAQLLTAAVKGRDGEIKALLSGRVDHNSCDRLGYTALHEAVCFGHYETAKMLIQDGAEINKTIAHGGATVLHAAVQRGREHREFLPGARKTTPALSENHVKVVALLLQHDASTEHRRSYDNLTDLIRPLSGMDNETVQTYWEGIRPFTTEFYLEIRGPALHARFREPLFKSLPGSRGGIFSLVVSWPLSRCIVKRKEKKRCSSKDCDNNFANEETFRRFYDKSDDSPASFHAPCTLDQSYYLSLDNSDDRDKGQVVIKYVQRQEKLDQSATANAKPKRLLMVNQMWVWKFDAMTLVTAFPDRQHQDLRQPILSANISKDLKDNPPSTMSSMICRILEHVTGFVEAPNNASLSENLFHIFEQSIAFRAQEDANCYAKFYKLQRKLSNLGKEKESTKAQHQEMMQTESDICNITSEVEHLCEIKDIKDELRMIRRVFEDQRAVIDQYHAGRVEENSIVNDGRFGKEEEVWLLGGEEDELIHTKKRIELRISKVKSLIADASTVEDSLNHLLDLKQKQGNLIVVRDTRSLTNEAEERARDSAWKSKLLFIFTIVTVVFTPISFISSFLAVLTQDFPHLNDGEVAWAWWQVFVGCMIVEVLTFLAVAPWIEWNRFGFSEPWKRHDKKRQRDDEFKGN
ncbi:hypothetical protein NCS52_00785900 [Fusarium sp. LHS14.1]|nr:hypothetical protein NCS52_00785900 [Fusarium sp. LHS14.1]